MLSMNLRNLIQLGIIGILILISMMLTDLIWTFVTGFIVPFTGGLGLVSILVGFVLWFLGMAFMAFVIVWLLNRVGVRLARR